ncbi:MAG: HAMP domain-containing sensor histidine kinase [Coprobacillus sp.]
MIKKQKLLTCFIIIIVIITNALLYTYNNKYLYNDINGSYGVVDYTNSQQDIHFLTEGWQLYLNEDNISHIKDKKPDRITGIYTPLEKQKAIYRIQILHDNPSSFYTFIVPEIFSEYSLYINGKLIHQQDYIQTQPISVNGEKKLDCILVVNNQDHYYSGQVIPITFGETHAVMNMYNLQNYSHSLFVFISLISSIVMIMFYIFTGKEKKYLYATIFSFLLTGYLSHYFIHQFIPVTSVITYISEDICYYMMLTVLSFYLYQFYCQGYLHKKFIFGVCGFVITMCIIPYVYIHANHLLYYLGCFLKIDIFLLLIYTLFKYKKSTLLYNCIIVFVISYGFDYIYNFDPIYLGWNTEIAAIIILIAYNIGVIQKQIQLYKTYSILKIKKDTMVQYANRKVHDLKAPVATMQGYIELLQDDIENDQKTYILEKLEEKILTLTTRMNQLQNLEYETCLLNIQKINLRDFLNQIILEFQVHAIKNNIIIESELIDIYCSIDPQYFKVVIENLIINAFEHTHKNIIIKSYKENQTVIIEVINFGDIIEPCNIAHIFEQGFSTKGLSRGYGLYISNKIVEQHHGTLSVISNKDIGTHFIIKLPL